MDVRRLRRPAGEAGAATLEGAGTYALAALLVLAVAVAFVPGAPLLGDAARRAICLVTTLGQGSCAPLVTSAADHEPERPCVRSASGHTSRATVAAVVEVGAGERWLVEELSDGRYRVTRGQGASVGAEAGVGAELTVTWDDKTYGGAASAGVAARGEFHGGETYYVDSEDEAAALLAEHHEDNVEDLVVASGGPVRWLWEQGQDVTGLGDADFPDADETWVEAGQSASASAGATALVLSGGVEGSAAQVLGYRRGADGTQTTYMRATLEGSAGLGMWAPTGGQDFGYGGGAAGGRMEALVEVEHDADGQVTSVRLRSVMAGEVKGGGDGSDPAEWVWENREDTWTERTVELPVRSDADRLVAQDVLRSLGAVEVGGLQVPGASTAVAAVSAPGALDAVSAFAEAAAMRGYTTDQSFTYDSSSYGGTLAGELLAKVGGGVEVTTLSRQSESARYFDGAGWREWAC